LFTSRLLEVEQPQLDGCAGVSRSCQWHDCRSEVGPDRRHGVVGKLGI